MPSVRCQDNFSEQDTRAISRGMISLEEGMRLAIVNNERSPPSPGLTGSCPACGSPVLAKCGNQRVHHWAHRGEKVCDHWWEPETEWHRNWKLNFPEAWQEVLLHDRTGEKHIADVRTSQYLAIEFQHSHLRPEECAAREDFYGDMVWVVDGLRLRRDLPRFKEGARDLRSVVSRGVFVHQRPDELFPRVWLIRKAPVFFDFGSGSPADPQVPVGRSLCCLLPQRGQPYAVVLKFSRQDFIRVAREQSKLLLGQSIQAKVDQLLATEQQHRAHERMRRDQEILLYRAALLKRASRPKPYGWRRRWR